MYDVVKEVKQLLLILHVIISIHLSSPAGRLSSQAGIVSIVEVAQQALGPFKVPCLVLPIL